MRSLVSHILLQISQTDSQLANTVPLLNDEADYVFAKELGHIGGEPGYLRVIEAYHGKLSDEFC